MLGGPYVNGAPTGRSQPVLEIVLVGATRGDPAVLDRPERERVAVEDRAAVPARVSTAEDAKARQQPLADRHGGGPSRVLLLVPDLGGAQVDRLPQPPGVRTRGVGGGVCVVHGAPLVAGSAQGRPRLRSLARGAERHMCISVTDADRASGGARGRWTAAEGEPGPAHVPTLGVGLVMRPRAPLGRRGPRAKGAWRGR
jgi:hypothetical protein